MEHFAKEDKKAKKILKSIDKLTKEATKFTKKIDEEKAKCIDLHQNLQAIERKIVQAGGPKFASAKEELDKFQALFDHKQDEVSMMQAKIDTRDQTMRSK